LPAWEVFIALGVAVVSSSLVVDFLTRAYVLCPDRKDQYYIIDLDLYSDGDGCEQADWGIPLAIVAGLTFAGCAWAVKSPYAQWKAEGLAKPRYPMTVGQENPDIFYNGEQPSGADVAARQRVANWPAYCSWDERPLDWLSRFGLPLMAVLCAFLPVLGLVFFLGQDLNEVYGPEMRTSGSYAGQPREVETPVSRRDSNFISMVLFFNIYFVVVAIVGTYCTAAASELRKGMYFRPWELGRLTCYGFSGAYFYDPTPLLSGGTPKRQSAFRQHRPVVAIQQQDADGNP